MERDIVTNAAMVDKDPNMDESTGTEKPARRTDPDEWKSFGHYMSKKQEKLWAQFDRDKEFESTKSDIFRGVCIFVNGLTDPPADELRRLMQHHGGEFHLYETSRVTHVVASNLCHSKLIQAKASDRIVKAQWITDSINQGRLLPVADYLLVKEKSGDLLKYVGRGKSDEKRDHEHSPEIVDQSAHEILHRDSNGSTMADERPSTSSSDPNPSVIPKRVPTAGDPNFLRDYYARSRLHFISTWAQEMKCFVNELKAEADPSSSPGVGELRNYVTEMQQLAGSSAFSSFSSLEDNGESTGADAIMHLDMDCFFVSVGLRKRPELRGQPVAVAHSTGVKPTATTVGQGPEETLLRAEFSSRSEIASCSYEARACGIHNGMYLGKAKKLCPNLKTIPYDFEEYHQVSKMLYTIVASFTMQIEPVSCDEVYMDIGGLCRVTGATPLDVATVIRRKIYEQCQCPSSAGIGPNMLVARLATRRAKPNGQFQVNAKEVMEFMAGQKVEDIPGVGYESSRKLRALDVETCQQLWSIPLSVLRQQFGAKTTDQIYNFSKGSDKRRLKTETVRKSVSCDMNYGIRFVKKEEVHKFLQDFVGEVVNRLRKHKVKGRMIILKLLIRSLDAPIEPSKFLGCGMCDAVTRSSTLATLTDDSRVIARECISLFDQISPVITDLRGIGVSIQKLESTDSNGGVPSSNTGSILKFVQPDALIKASKEPTSFPTSETSNADVIAQSNGQRCRGAVPLAEPTSVSSPKRRRTSHRKGSTGGCLFETSSYEETKSLLAAWVSTSQEPCELDVKMVSDYLVSLIDKLELHKVPVLLGVLKRSISAEDKGHWSAAYSAIVTDIQSAMRVRYGCPVRLGEEETG